MFGSGRTSGLGLRGMTEEQIVAMDLEPLARVVLRDLRERAGQGHTSLSDWATRMRRHYGRKSPAMGAVSEAVGFLWARMFICEDLAAVSEGSWVMVTRAGHAWLGGPAGG